MEKHTGLFSFLRINRNVSADLTVKPSAPKWRKRLSTCTWGFDPQEETAKTVARQKARSSFASETNVIEVLGSLKWSTGACDKIWASNSLKQSEHYTQHWNKTQVHTKLFCRPSWTQMISSVSKEFMNASWSEYVAGWKCYFFLNSFLYQ